MRRDRLELLLASFLMLFVELVLIRWAGAYVVYLSYFSNFILLGSFLGIGVGFLRARKGPDLFRWAPFALALLTGLVKGLPVVIDRSGGDLIYFGALATTGLPAWIMLPFLFLATATVMAMIAHGVAVRFARFTPLEAYRLDISGSLLGIAAYAGLAFIGAPPLVWAIVVAASFWVLLDGPRAVEAAALVALIALFAVGTFQGDVTWSPYYRVEAFDRLGVRVNGIPHQTMIRTPGTSYDIPFQRAAGQVRDVLVVGAGNGNDVSAALRAGARRVDAVEIDPVLQRLGEERHPERPYDDPRVRPVIDDGRAFLERTEARYDVIIFALPDSLTLVSGQSAVRLESYLFTREAFEAARRHLRPRGVFSMYNFYRERWLLDRLGATLRGVFGVRPCLDLGPESRTEVGRYAMLATSADHAALRCGETWEPRGEIVAPATDDRPFVYLRERSIPSRYLWTLALVLGASALLVRAAGGRFRSMGGALDLFFMGAAFLLLETKSVVQFALLFGTTWFVNALVFAGILLTVLLAIEVERRVRIGRPWLLFGLLFLGLFLAAIVPAEALLSMAVVPRFVVATALAFFPVFIANLVFAERFRDSDDPTRAFGANLLGAMVGGALEYLSLVTGYRALLLLAAGLYALAWATGGRKIGRSTEAAQAHEREPALNR
jgi:SAM-dependent methyltransferase